MKQRPSSASRAEAPAAESSFPIVGIGASAGGFEALEQFMANVPEDSGMAFVIVQHLDPTRKGLMPELLQRGTRMKVTQVKDRTRVRPNRVYVIPPNKNMSILHGVLHLFEPSAKRGQRLPIDFFLSSLAHDQQRKAIGVILSGMGSDGTPGLREIREKGGLAAAQEPSSAKFDSMPRSVIDAGLADIVAPADELPGRIIARLQRAPQTPERAELVETGMRGALEKILILMRSRTGHDFSFYKKNTLHRRIERRMGIHQIDRIASYVRFLNENPEELDLLFKRAPHRRDRIFPRSGSVAAAARKNPAGSPRQPPHAGAAGVGRRMLHRRGGLHAGHRLPGGGGGAQAGKEFQAPDLRHGSRPGRDRQGAPGGLFRKKSRRTSRRSNCGATSPRRRAATGCAPRSGKW
jgi:hypothetical protein